MHSPRLRKDLGSVTCLPNFGSTKKFHKGCGGGALSLLIKLPPPMPEAIQTVNNRLLISYLLFKCFVLGRAVGGLRGSYKRDK